MDPPNASCIWCVPHVTRCILRAADMEGYRDILRHPLGSFSLPNELAAHHDEIALDQRIPATDVYPEMTVVDLLPATRVRLGGAAATCVVLPPAAPESSAACTDTAAASPCAACSDAAAAMVRVCLDGRLGGGGVSRCVANASFMTALALEANTLMALGGDGAYSCVFVAEAEAGAEVGDVPPPPPPTTPLRRFTGGADAPATRLSSSSFVSAAPTLRVSPDLFRNLRAAYYHRPRFDLSDPPCHDDDDNDDDDDDDAADAAAAAAATRRRAHFAQTVLSIPLDDFVPQERDDGELLTRDDGAAWGRLALTELLLCPALDDVVLTNAHGSAYDELLTIALRTAAPVLHGRLVGEGDVLSLPLPAALRQWCTRGYDADVAVGALVEGVDVVESVHRGLRQAVERGEAVWLGEEEAAAAAATTTTTTTTTTTMAVRVVQVGCDAANTHTNGANAATACRAGDDPKPSPRRRFGVIVLHPTAGPPSPSPPSPPPSLVSTRIALVSPSHPSAVRAARADGTPRAPPAPPAVWTCVAGRRLRRTLQNWFTPAHRRADATRGHRRRAAGVLVLHAGKENWPGRLVGGALSCFGVPAMEASVEGLREAELRTLLTALHGVSHPMALILRHAELLASAYAHLMPYVDGSARETTDGAEAAEEEEEEEEANSLPGGGGAVAPARLVVLVCETVEAPVPLLAAQASHRDGVLVLGNPGDADREHYFAVALREEVCAAHHIRPSLLLTPALLASWTVGLSYADLAAYLAECVRQTVVESALTTTTTPCALCRRRRCCSGGGGEADRAGAVRAVLSEQRCEAVLPLYLRDYGHHVVSTKLQPVRWSDVGGLQEAKREIEETIQLPLRHPELFAHGVKRRTGILFYGPPGCGKTLLAKAVATEMNMNFMSVKGPELINQYVGESEKNIRQLFQRARDNSPCIVFFDELDALAPARGAKGDAGGAMDRIVSQLLVEVDGVGQRRSDGSASGSVFVIGATNRPDLLDPSLLRPGRFDRLCYLGLPSTREEQRFTIAALTRKFDLEEDVDVEELLAPMEPVYTGADFFALCSDAMMFAVEEKLDQARIARRGAVGETEKAEDTDGAPEDGTRIDDTSADDAEEEETGGLEEEEEGEEGEGGSSRTERIRVGMRHFVRARDQLKPSVTKEDLRRYEMLKNKFNV